MNNKPDYGLTPPTNSFELTRNWFQCFDLELAEGENTLTLSATDQAGNVASVNLTVTYDISQDIQASAITVHWPQEDTKISGSAFTVRGILDDPTATITAQKNGLETVFEGIVERNGLFWIENLPLTAGANTVTLIAKDVKGNTATVVLNVEKSLLNLTINDPTPEDLAQSYLTVSGTINSADYTVWVNGMRATGGASWTAENVALNPGGTAVIQATAIPNSANNGDGSPSSPSTTSDPDGDGSSDANGGSQGQPGNPSDPNQVKTEVTREADYKILVEQHDNWYQDHYGVVGSYKSSIQRDYYFKHFHPLQAGADGWCGRDFQEFTVPNQPRIVEQRRWRADQSGEEKRDAYPPGTGITTYDWRPTNRRPIEHYETCWWPLQKFEVPYFEIVDTTDIHRICTTRIHLQTGGKGRTGSSALFALTVGATQMKAPLGEETGPAIPPENLRVRGQQVGSGGKVYLGLPENGTYDITPSVAASAGYVFRYRFGVGVAKHRLIIKANTDDLSVTVPEYTISQGIRLSATFDPGLSPMPMIDQCWVPDGEFVNREVRDQRGFQSSSPYWSVWWEALRDSSPLIFWTRGGNPEPARLRMRYSATLRFPNGQTCYLVASGALRMYEPRLTPGFISYHNPTPSLGTFSNHQGMTLRDAIGPYLFTNEIDSKVGGLIQFTQLMKRNTRYLGTTKFPNTTGGEFWLDVSESAGGGQHLGLGKQWFPFNDEPGSQFPGSPATGLLMDDEFVVYVRFRRSAGSAIYATLGTVTWKWHGEANKTGGEWSISSNSSSDPPVGHWNDRTFPRWFRVYHNIE